MPNPNRQKYFTAVALFLVVVCVYFGMQMSASAQGKDFTFRAQVRAVGQSGSTVFVYNAADTNSETAAHAMTDFVFPAKSPSCDDPLNEVCIFNASAGLYAFDQSTSFLTDVELVVDTDAVNNSSNQWKIQYTEIFPSQNAADWLDLVDSVDFTEASGGDVSRRLFKAPITTTDIENDVGVRVITQQLGSGSTDPANPSAPQVRLWDVRVEANFDSATGGGGPLVIATASPLPDGVAGEAYPPPGGGGIDIAAIGGFPTSFTWCYSGSLPTGLDLRDSLDTVNITTCPTNTDSDNSVSLKGSISTTAAGSYTFTVEITDGTQSAQKTFLLDVEGLGIDPPNRVLPVGKKGSVYPPPPLSANINFTPIGGSGTYDWCYSGALPDGLSLTDGTDNVPLCGNPPLTSAQADGHIILSGSTQRAKTYNFSLRVVDSSAPPYQITKDYTIEVRAAGVTIKPATFAPLVRGVPYGSAGGEFPLFLQASGVVNSPPVTWTVPSAGALPGALAQGSTQTDPAGAPQRSSAVEINGIVNVSSATTPTGKYPFTVQVNDPGNTVSNSDTANLVLEVLPRKTILAKAPPATVQLPQDSNLSFTVSALGGAPSLIQDALRFTYTPITDESLLRIGDTLGHGPPGPPAVPPFSTVVYYTYNWDAANQIAVADTTLANWNSGDSIQGPLNADLIGFTATIAAAPAPAVVSELISPPGKAQYTYAWLVTPVGAQSPALGANNGITSTRKTEPETIAISFTDALGETVTGTYDVKFWAQDKIARDNPPNAGPPIPNHPDGADANDAYEFAPATARITVSPSEKAGRPIKLRQEQFR
jgi:hypothetical protein